MPDDVSRAQIASRICPYLTAKQTAFHLGIAVSTLKRMRQTGQGPRYRKHGRTCRYHIDDIDAWSIARARGGDNA